MSTEKLRTGDSVTVVSGIYEGVRGTVEDIQLECSVIRLRDAEGESVYALADTVQKLGEI
jgi:hypothetical protein